MEGAVGGTPMDDEFSRREFLNYAWLASLGILTVETGVVTLLFAMPRLAPGEFGGPIDVGSVDALPGEGADPEPFNKAKFWWVVTPQGALALYKVCTHLGCIFKWSPEEYKFICPCHGSQFEREGEFIQGPAPRGLDRFVITAYDNEGAVLAQTPETGGPVTIPAGARIVVDTGTRISGPPRQG
jgi:cytochrome b6-f complex iron-sulfur subunit